MRVLFRQAVIELVRGDITKESTDAMVNAANSELLPGGGVDGAIRRAGGEALQMEIEKIRLETGGCPTGSAVVTPGGRLPARWVIHAVGPVWKGGNEGEPAQLASAFRESFRLAEKVGARSISFPAISTGAYGFPAGEAASIALRTAIEYLEHASPLRTVRFVLFDDAIHQEFARTLASMIPTRRYSTDTGSFRMPDTFRPRSGKEGPGGGALENG